MMIARYKLTATAILPMAVLLVCWLGGCATQRQVSELRGEIRDLATQTDKTHERVVRMDSTIAAGAESDNRLRADMAMSVDELGRQVAVLLENYSDLMRKIDEMNQRPPVTHVLTGSQGAQPDVPATEAKTTIDCNNTYDESFILVRRAEYEKAIEGFRKFLTDCPNHENVENAHYWIGECYYSQDKHAEAVAELEYLVREYQSSSTLGRAYYKLARSKQELGKKDEAKDIFQRLVDDYPGTLEAEQARERLKELN